MKRFIFSALVLSGMTANAQVKDGMVGINTDEPRATMHIEPGVSESKGLIIPRITAAQMVSMSNLAHFGADHHAIITYLKEQLPLADRTGKLVDVAAPGYYYYDNTTGVQKWKTFGGAEQDLRAVGNNDHITKDAGIGENGTSAGTGYRNIGIGQKALLNGTSGSDNIAIGSHSLKSLTVGHRNVAIGSNTLENNTTGSNNVGIGSAFYFPNGGTISSNTNVGIGLTVYSLGNGGSMTGNGNNIGLGNSVYTLQKVNAQFSGDNNIGMGTALYSLTSGNMEGNNNIAIGQSSYSVVNGDITNTAKNNISLGAHNYKLTNTSGSTFSGASNIGIGERLYNVRNNFTGNRNIGMGRDIFMATGDFAGSDNIGFGGGALSAVGNVTGNNNIGMGLNTLSSRGNVSGSNNIALGYSAMNVFSTGDMTGNANIALGFEAYNSQGVGGLTGSNNVAIGYQALKKTNGTTGSNNVAVGYSAGMGLVFGSGNVHIGSRDLATDTPGEPDNVVFLGSGIYPYVPIEDNTIIIGHAGTTNATKVGMGTYQPQAKLDVNGGVRVANDTSACSSANEGTIRYDGTNFYGCTSSGWKQLNN